MIRSVILVANLGAKNLAVNSDREIHHEEHIKENRDRRDKLKLALQSKDTKSAKRHQRNSLAKWHDLQKILTIAFQRY